MTAYLLLVRTSKLDSVKTPASTASVADQQRGAIESLGGTVLGEFVCGGCAESGFVEEFPGFITEFPRDKMLVDWRRAADARGFATDALRMYGGAS